MRPETIRELLASEIERLIDPTELFRMREIEAAERKTLESLDFSRLRKEGR